MQNRKNGHRAFCGWVSLPKRPIEEQYLFAILVPRMKVAQGLYIFKDNVVMLYSVEVDHTATLASRSASTETTTLEDGSQKLASPCGRLRMWSILLLRWPNSFLVMLLSQIFVFLTIYVTGSTTGLFDV